MFNKIFTIKKIKKLRNQDIDRHFLAAFRNELADHVSKNPVIKKDESRLLSVGGINIFTYFNNLNFKLMPALIIALIALITTGGGVAAASQSSLPNDALYPVKILTEEVREAVTFDNTAKARLHAEYAAERVAEVQKVIEEKGVNAKGLDVALANLKEHASQVASLVEGERNHGKNVSALAKELQNKIEKAKTDLENNLDSVATKATSTEVRKTWREKIENIKSEIENNEDRIGKSEEFKKEAETAILEAQKKLTEGNQSVLASSTELIKFNAFMDKASTSLSKEHWVQARQQARQAEKTLEKVENKIEKNIQKEEGDENNKDNENRKENEKVQKLDHEDDNKKGNGHNNDASSVDTDDDEENATTTRK